MLVLVGAVGSLYLTLYGWPLRIDARPHQALGQTLAQEALKLGGAGTHVTLITRDTSLYLNPAIDALNKRFVDTLVRGGGKLTFTHSVKVDPLRITSVQPGDFLQVLKKVAETDVVVSLLGPPTLSGEQWASLKGKSPKVVAVCSPQLLGQADLKSLAEQGLLRLAIVHKTQVPSAAPAVDTPEAWFDHLFALVTPTNLSEVVHPAHP